MYYNLLNVNDKVITAKNNNKNIVKFAKNPVLKGIIEGTIDASAANFMLNVIDVVIIKNLKE